LADPIPGDSTDRLCDLAKRYDVMLCVGLAEKDGDRNGPRRHDNTRSVDGIYIYGGQSVVADSKGKILAVGADRDSDVVIVEVELK